MSGIAPETGTTERGKTGEGRGEQMIEKGRWRRETKEKVLAFRR
jgi:hypothetical protein